MFKGCSKLFLNLCIYQSRNYEFHQPFPVGWWRFREKRIQNRKGECSGGVITDCNNSNTKTFHQKPFYIKQAIMDGNEISWKFSFESFPLSIRLAGVRTSSRVHPVEKGKVIPHGEYKLAVD